MDPVGYCRKCLYDLRGLPSNTCPECGQTFDLSNPKTFHRHLPSKLWPWLRRGLYLLILLALLTSLPLAWLCYGWKREQPAIARMKALGAAVRVRNLHPPLIPRLMPKRLQWLLDRVDHVGYSGDQWAATDWALIGRCRYLTGLEVWNQPMSDAAIEMIAGFRDLQWVSLDGRGINDAVAARLAQCRQWRMVYLFNTSLTDAGLAHLCRMPERTALAVQSEAITDEGLAALANLPKLETLNLYAPAVGDAGLANLGYLSKLKRLSLHDGRWTDAGIQRLKAALPSCRVDADPSPASPASQPAAPWSSEAGPH